MKKTLISGLIGLSFAALVGFGATLADAQPISSVLNLAGTVSGGTAASGAAVAPFSAGDNLAGTLTLDSGLLSPGGAFGINAFDSFDIAVGPVEFTTASPGTLSVFGQVSSNGAIASILNLSTGQGLSADCPTCSLTLATGASQSLEVDNAGAAALGTIETPRFKAPVSPPRTAAVPEPSAFVLLGFGLIGIILAERYRRKRVASPRLVR